MKLILFSLSVFFAAGTLRATEKLWIPLATPVGQMAAMVQGTPNTTPQPTETVTMVPKVKQGRWVYKYPDGHSESEGNYTAGQKDGVWKYYLPNGDECREIEFKNGRLAGGAVLFGATGGQKYTDQLVDMVQKAASANFTVKTILPYWVDLLGDGDHQILAIVRGEASSLILVLDPNGNLLDSKVFSGLVDDFTFGEIKKGGPVCFGYDISCDPQLGVCQWEFDVWDGAKIKTVLQYQGWYGDQKPFTMPVFQDVQDQVGIVTDNGQFQWDEAQQSFKKVSN